MRRIEPAIIADHLEVALFMAPPTVIEGLSDPDLHSRRRAVGRLVEHLVSRLSGFQIVFTDTPQQDCSPELSEEDFDFGSDFQSAT